MIVKPNIICDNMDELNKQVKVMLDNIKAVVWEWIVANEVEYQHMMVQGFCHNQSIHIYECIYEELNTFIYNMTNSYNAMWCQDVVDNITNCIDITLSGLISINKISSFTPDELALYVQRIITLHLYESNKDGHIFSGAIHDIINTTSDTESSTDDESNHVTQNIFIQNTSVTTDEESELLSSYTTTEEEGVISSNTEESID